MWSSIESHVSPVFACVFKCVCTDRTQACKLMCGLSRWIKDTPWRVCNSADVCLSENAWCVGTFIGKTLYSSSYRAPYWGLTAWYCLWVFEYVVTGGEFIEKGFYSFNLLLSLSVSLRWSSRFGSVWRQQQSHRTWSYGSISPHVPSRTSGENTHFFPSHNFINVNVKWHSKLILHKKMWHFCVKK